MLCNFLKARELECEERSVDGIEEEEEGKLKTVGILQQLTQSRLLLIS